MRTNFDTPWKLVLERFFKDLVDFLLPHIATEIDWTKPYQFLDKELLSIQKNTKVGNKLSDKLIKVYNKYGEEAWVIVHIEVQGSKESKFAERMWQYYYRIYDKYQKPLMSVAILTDENRQWRPNNYQRDLWGCHLFLEYPIVKLIDFITKVEKMEYSHNPIAKVIQAHLVALKTRGNASLRLENKLSLVKKLYPLGYTKEDIRTLYAFIDYALTLPIAIEKEFIEKMIRYEEEVGMQYITSAERIGIEKGREDGIRLGREDGGRNLLKVMLQQKFGHLHTEILELLEKANLEQLEKMSQVFIAANSEEELLYKLQAIWVLEVSI
ncbi:MAG: hypothetical protein JSR17_07460 [Proteobacteria bacterium]|nr:hypothetical protein [Pseudomonadota bacterium]